MLAENIERVRETVADACARAGRSPEEITVVGVSKTVDAATAQHAAELGLADLGENRVQSLLDKYAVMGDAVRWHLIGHLQTNKVKYIADKVCLIHSVDSLHLAEEISRQAARAGRDMDILLQVNVAKEPQKFGMALEETEEIACAMAELEHIHVRGLMTIAPKCEHAEDNRKYFSTLYKKFVDIGRKKYDNIAMDILSMGMTEDYVPAIMEGATHIRVGRGIFAD